MKTPFKSIYSKTYPHIEHIIIDGGSTDGTLDIISRVKSHGSRIAKLISEPDEGIYDAMNKGIRLATGDVIGILNSDDVYADNSVIENVMHCFSDNKLDSCYGDLVYVGRNDTTKVIRYWRAGSFNKERFKKGWMPPHPTFFVKREIYEKYVYFNTSFKISADYELILRFLYKYKVSTCFIPKVLIMMRFGGESNRSLKNLMAKTSEDYRAWKVNNLKRGFYTIPFKNLSNIPQFFKRKI